MKKDLKATWLSMKYRCYNGGATGYHRYGGRGIRVCKRWFDSFDLFVEDMGARPKGLTLDRKNNDGNYQPSNCRWATAKQQANNRADPSTFRKRRTKEEMANTVIRSVRLTDDLFNRLETEGKLSYLTGADIIVIALAKYLKKAQRERNRYNKTIKGA